MFNGRRAEWNGGWEGFDPLPYTVLSEADFMTHLGRLADHRVVGSADCASFQPFPVPHANQDRYSVLEFDVPGSASEETPGFCQWRLWAVFDGHAGHATVDYAVRALPSTLIHRIRDLYASSTFSSPSISPSSSPSPPPSARARPTTAHVTGLLSRTITEFDTGITQGVHDLFPGGPSSLAVISDEEIARQVILDGWTHPTISKCLTGTTALIVLLDPARRLYVCSLGDCTAVLGRRMADGTWNAEVLSTAHNARETDEVERIRKEHPDEPECVVNDRVLGGIAVTRAIGDQVFKLPTIYTQRVFDIADPSAHIYARLAPLLTRNLTPPYVSNIPDVRVVDLAGSDTGEMVLLLASDGLADLYETESAAALEEAAVGWVQTIVAATQDTQDGDSGNAASSPAVQLLRAGMAGGEVEKASWYLTVEMDSPWVDDITVVVDRL